MPLSYKTLFLLDADAFSLVEIKALDVHSDDPAQVYFWFRFEKATHHLDHLTFVSMAQEGAEQQREFQQGRLQFAQHEGTYATPEAGAPVPLRVLPPSALPAELDEAIQRYFVGA